MNKEVIKEILYIAIAIILAYLAIRFVIWALPVILIGLLALFIYISIKKDKYKKSVNKSTNKNKKIKVIHEFDDKD